MDVVLKIISHVDDLQKYRQKHLSVPGKRETTGALKLALEHMKRADLEEFATLLDIPFSPKMSTDALKLNIMDYVAYVVHGHTIAAWNNTARWAFLLILVKLLWTLAKMELDPKKWGYTLKTITANTSTIILILVSLFGTSLTFQFLKKFRTSWNVRQIIRENLTRLASEKRRDKDDPPPPYSSPQAPPRPPRALRPGDALYDPPPPRALPRSRSSHFSPRTLRKRNSK